MRSIPLLLLTCLAALPSAGCEDSAAAGPAGTAGAGGTLDPTSPEAYLSADRYDCSASGPFEPPPRPHPVDCYADPSCTSPLVAGHRMSTQFAPENSLSALRAAILLGVDIVETDVRLTADGVVVLIHDGTIDRTLEGSGEVSQLTLAQIQAIPMKTEGKPAGDYGCDRVPTLEQAMDVAAGKVVVELEVKDSDAGVQAAQELSAAGLLDTSFFLCDTSECEALRAAVPDAPIMTRPQAPEEVASHIAYQPPPILVHIDPWESFLTPEVLDAIHGVGAKAFANAFLAADVEALTSGRLAAYVEMYDSGLDVVQTEFPHWALTALGRLPAP